MIKIKRIFKINVLAVLLIGFLTVTVHGQGTDFKPVADEMFGSSGITFVPRVSYSQLELTISRPDGTVFKRIFSSGSTPYADLSGIFGGSYLDGSYTYELVVFPALENRARGTGDDSFASRRNNERLTQSGGFYVQGGAIITNNLIEPEMDGGISFSTSQDGLSGTQAQVFTTDLIVQGSACIGVDCSSSESFGFDTLRLKENNLRIHFDDTSSSASFPKNDWRISINDSNNGGPEYFRVEDATNNKNPFTIEANTPSNTLYVDSTGRIGIGTSAPVVNAHIKDGNTPTLRLEQDGSDGFTPQTWDVAGNETNFFVRDVTNGSQLPFKILPGADHNSLVIDGNNDVGVGTLTPDFPFEVERTGTGAQVVATRTDGAQMEFSASGNFGIAGTRTDHPLKFRVNLADIMQLNATGNYIQMLQGGGYYDGNWVNGSSRELKENIKNLSTDDALEALEGLNPVRYNYKNKKEEHVGFIAEDVPELVAQDDRKSLSTLDVVGVLTKVVQEQQKTISELKEKVAELEKNSR